MRQFVALAKLRYINALNNNNNNKEMMGFRDAVASAGPYANNLHLAPDRPHQHLITQLLQARCSS